MPSASSQPHMNLRKKEISDLTRMVQVLRKEVQELRNENNTNHKDDGDKENGEPTTRTKTEKWTWRDGIGLDKFWSWTKRKWYIHEKLKAKDRSAWNKLRKAQLTAELEKLA